ncbi:TAXI family TRAP transporter solute-binding subunit [Marinobacter confluentis]|uniref:TAXI family TRAP transporter solute-binding subunit n=1 Tax=Marinobacter confluentis TaxID=1697557 RepID=A0A4Z1BNZ0_9GAMM|nr:TAXI family TRAP transporter solute-binding subunit [Marinobacter confluentis]TGN39187.1 TAXI family TRAP transporter solute-binding subunit [Marinobacter confluentis]
MRKLLIAASASLLMGAVSAQAETNLSIATGGTGGTYYPLGGGLAELISTEIDGYKAVAEVTGASVENMGLVHRQDSDLAIALADTVHQAYHGGERFNGNKLDVAAIASLYPNAVQIVTLADSGITSLSDLAGKRVSVGAPGSGTEVNAKALLESNGMSFEDFDVRSLNFNESADALRDGDIDAGFWSVGPPTSSIVSLANTRDIALISLSEEEVANAREAVPVFAPYELRKGIYEGLDQPTASIGIPNVLTVNTAMSEDLAYKITKLLFDKVEDLRAIHPAADDTTVEFSLQSTPIPLHPGAIRYYEEIGATIPDNLRP